jgi:hypothetical protein
MVHLVVRAEERDRWFQSRRILLVHFLVSKASLLLAFTFKKNKGSQPSQQMGHAKKTKQFQESWKWFKVSLLNIFKKRVIF